MYSKELVALAAALSTASATVYQGFNYGAGLDYDTEFALAKALVGTDNAFTSARLYTMIEEGTTDTPTSAISAAISNDVTLLLGLWASGGSADFLDEIAALKSAISTYGTEFTSRVAAISVGSEDLYRISPTGVENDSGVGAEPSVLVEYIAQVKAAIDGTDLEGALVGHVDTWTAWVNGSNDAVITACDFIGMDAYPYYQNTVSNGIANAYDLFFSAYDQTVSAAGSKPVWVTETGWPVSGKTENDAVASTANAKTYWDAVGCKLFGSVNTYWYTLEDSGSDPSFGVTTGSDTPLYSLTCSATTSSSSSSSTASSTSTSSSDSTATSASASTTAAADSTSTDDSSSSATATSEDSTATSATDSSSTSQALVSVSTTVSATEAGSPAESTFASADSSAASEATASSSEYASAVASASSAASAAATDSSATVAATASSEATSSETGTSTASATSAVYTGGASTVRSTGGFVAALVAVLAVL